MAFIGAVRLYTDGGSRGNPGSAAIAVVVTDASNNELQTHKECIGHTTNNQAEYRALIKGLKLCAKHTNGRVTVYMDSELVVKQMNGGYRVKNDRLQELFQEVKDAERFFREEVTYNHVPRTNANIRKADRLVNEALDAS